MLILPLPGISKRRRQKRPTAPLLLVSAVYEDSPFQWLTLSFSRPIDISAYHGSVIQVNDADFNQALFAASGTPTLLDPVTLRIRLTVIDDSTGTGVQLNASAGNGIVAVGDLMPWTGVEGLELPYP